MKKAVCFALALGMLCSCASGLPQGREIGDMALMRTMGVDWAGEDLLEVTLSSSRRARGLQGEEEKPLVLTARRPSISGACLAIQSQSGHYVFTGHIDQLLLGTELAEQGGVFSALEHFGQDDQLGLGAQLWLVREDTAQSAIRAEEETGADRRLSTLQKDAQMGVAGVERTVGEVLCDLLERECSFVPALGLGEGADTALFPVGYAVLTPTGLAGWLAGEAALGLELARERPGSELAELSGASVRVYSSALTCAPAVEGEKLTGLELDLRLMAQVEQQRGEADLQGWKEELCALGQKRLEKLVAQLQRWNADCLGLSAMAGRNSPEHWALIRRTWKDVFPELKVTVRCTAALTGKDQ